MSALLLDSPDSLFFLHCAPQTHTTLSPAVASDLSPAPSTGDGDPALPRLNTCFASGPRCARGPLAPLAVAQLTLVSVRLPLLDSSGERLSDVSRESDAPEP